MKLQSNSLFILILAGSSLSLISSGKSSFISSFPSSFHPCFPSSFHPSFPSSFHPCFVYSHTLLSLFPIHHSLFHESPFLNYIQSLDFSEVSVITIWIQLSFNWVPTEVHHEVHLQQGWKGRVNKMWKEDRDDCIWSHVPIHASNPVLLIPNRSHFILIQPLLSLHWKRGDCLGESSPLSHASNFSIDFSFLSFDHP